MIRYNIVFTVDSNYVQHLAVAISSLLENNKNLNFDIYVISDHLPKGVLDKIQIIVSRYSCNIFSILIENQFDQLILTDHFSKANYYRLFIPELINLDRALYLDSDIVVNGSIVDLYNMNIEDSFVAAVEDLGFDSHYELGMAPNSKYFNSGVLLLNLAKWRQSDLTKKIVEFITLNPKVIKYVDQCGMNAIINGRWRILDFKYNQQSIMFEDDFFILNDKFSKANLIEAFEKPVIVHFTGSSKPWHLTNTHPYRSFYFKYLRKTPYFYSYILSFLTFRNFCNLFYKFKILIKIFKQINLNRFHRAYTRGFNCF